MSEVNMQAQIDGLNSKLDIILEEIEHQRRHRREMEDLKDDLMRVGADVFHTAVEELDEMSDSIGSGDIVHLGKKLMRNVNNLTATFEQLESMRDLVKDVGPISKELFSSVLIKMDEYDRKGYFEFARELQNVADNVVTSFSVEDIKLLSNNIVSILNMVKNLTQPDMLKAIDNAVMIYKNLDVTPDKKVSMVSLVKEMNTPEVKQGMSFMLKFLSNISKQQNIKGESQ